MIKTGLRTCEPTTVRLILIDEALLTAVSVTPETAERYGRSVTFGQHDPRLASTRQLLETLPTEATPHRMISFAPFCS